MWVHIHRCVLISRRPVILFNTNMEISHDIHFIWEWEAEQEQAVWALFLQTNNKLSIWPWGFVYFQSKWVSTIFECSAKSSKNLKMLADKVFTCIWGWVGYLAVCNSRFSRLAHKITGGYKSRMVGWSWNYVIIHNQFKMTSWVDLQSSWACKSSLLLFEVQLSLSVAKLNSIVFLPWINIYNLCFHCSTW